MSGEVVPKRDLSSAVETYFDRITDYFPPPVYVGRMQSLDVSQLVSVVVLVVSLRPAMKMRKDASTPMVELRAVGSSVSCVLVTLILQYFSAGFVYNMAMYAVNRQHFANTHWVGQYTKAASSSFM